MAGGGSLGEGRERKNLELDEKEKTERQKKKMFFSLRRAIFVKEMKGNRHLDLLAREGNRGRPPS